MDYRFVNENVVEKLGQVVKDKEKAFVVFCFDIPSENHKDISDEEKGTLLLKRMNFKNFIDKYATYVSNSVYLMPYGKIQSLLQVFDEHYGEIADKYHNVALNIMGVHFDSGIVKDMIVEHIKNTEKKAKNFFEYVQDTSKAKNKEEVAKMRRDYKKVIRWINIMRLYRIQDLRLLDSDMAGALKTKLDNVSYSKNEVSYKIDCLENELRRTGKK